MSDEPPPINDPVFGRLVWDDEWTLLGEIECGHGHRVPVLLFIDPDHVAPVDLVRDAREALLRFRRDERRYRLLSGAALNKRRWNDEVVMTDEDVANLLLIATLEFQDDGRLAVFWNDDDHLFAGHNVVTRIDADGTFLDAHMG